VILLMASDTQRLGVTVGKRVGKAHDRNRVKRLVREVFRRNKALFPALCDVVLVARPGSERLDYGTLEGEIARATAALARAERSLHSSQASAERTPNR
jgi:ribonuclease P protein component